MKKRLFSIVLSLCMVLALIPQMVVAETYGDFDYIVNDNEESGYAVTITGYNGGGGAVVIPETINDNPVISIRALSFLNCTSLRSITIPSSVTSIDPDAFPNCTNLTNVTFKENSQLKYIGDGAFLNCTSLTSVTIPNSVTSIGIESFYNCISLESIFLPDKDALSIGDRAISGTASQVKYSLDTDKDEVTITEITLGAGKKSVAIPATICGYPVVAVANNELLENISSHTCVGGEATCQTKAICGICKQEYGEKNPDNHTGTKVWEQNETQHKQYWNCCDAVVIDSEDHTWNNGVCSVCDYICKHKDTDKDHECDFCGESLPQQSSGTSDDSDNDSNADAEDSAKTGDDTNLALWLALMLLAGAGITGTTIYTRRKRTNE